MRVGFLIIPDFVFRAHLGEGGPLWRLDEAQRRRAVLVQGEGGRARLVATSPEVRAEGVRVNMNVAAARARVGHVFPVAYEAERVERESSKLAGVLLAASPQVHVVGDGVFWVGAAGCRFLGGEVALVALVDELVRQAGYREHRVGVADSVIAARAAAIHDLGIVPAGADTEALAPLPLSVLPLESSSRKALWALGIRTVGAFAALPVSQISARFDDDAVRAHRLARGQDPRTVPVFGSPESPAIEVDFESPHTVAEPALFVIRGGVDRLLSPHRARGFGAQCVKIELMLVDGRWEREIRPADPITDSERLVEMCRALLQDAELPSMMEGLRVSVVEVAPAKAHQEGFWESRRQRTVTLEYTLMRLKGRLGPQAVRMPGEVRDAYLPEQISHWVEVGLGPRSLSQTQHRCCISATWRLKTQPRHTPLQLERGVPVRVEMDGRWETIRRAVGPQRIETGWYEGQHGGPKGVDGADGADDDGPALRQPIRRDYWYVELSNGVALSLYRDLNTEEWFLQAILD